MAGGRIATPRSAANTLSFGSKGSGAQPRAPCLGKGTVKPSRLAMKGYNNSDLITLSHRGADKILLLSAPKSLWLQRSGPDVGRQLGLDVIVGEIDVAFVAECIVPTVLDD